MKILVTGTAGFIGSALTLRLLARGDTIVGIDNHNDYYDPAIKEARLERFINNSNYTHLRIDLANRKLIEETFTKYKPERVVNMAAQAGVRYSIENLTSGEMKTFTTLIEALNSLSLVHSSEKLPISIHDNDRLQVRLRARLETNELPAPLRLIALFFRDWQQTSKWPQWEIPR